MTADMLIEQLNEIAKACDDSRDQQVVKGCLLSILGAYAGRSIEPLFNHMCKFTEKDIERLKRTASSPNN